MLILSQDRTKLINLDNVDSIEIDAYDGYEEYAEVTAYVNGQSVSLGKYMPDEGRTAEKVAVEILQKIFEINGAANQFKMPEVREIAEDID